jgi:hypothetical protein
MKCYQFAQLLRRVDVEIICHRGWWTKPEEQNTLLAFRRAFQNGLGIELDVRDLDERIVVSHNPPSMRKQPLLFSEVLNLWREYNSPTLAVNIKADGLVTLLDQILLPVDFEKLFFFDMSFPEARRFEQAGLPIAYRLSEKERQPQDKTHYWIDAFECNWWQEEDLSVYPLNSGYLVSPELHGRSIGIAWSRAHQNPMIKAICTDLVDDALRFFANG